MKLKDILNEEIVSEDYSLGGSRRVFNVPKKDGHDTHQHSIAHKASVQDFVSASIQLFKDLLKQQKEAEHDPNVSAPAFVFPKNAEEAAQTLHLLTSGAYGISSTDVRHVEEIEGTQIIDFLLGLSRKSGPNHHA